MGTVSAQFDIANNLLGAFEGPQIVGPALYAILAKLPGVEDIGKVTDGFGRSGTGIEDPSTGYVFVIDPGTGQLLEHEVLSIASTATTESPVGTVRDATSYGPVAVVSELGVMPTAPSTATTGNSRTS